MFTPPPTAALCFQAFVEAENSYGVGDFSARIVFRTAKSRIQTLSDDDSSGQQMKPEDCCEAAGVDQQCEISKKECLIGASPPRLCVLLSYRPPPVQVQLDPVLRPPPTSLTLLLAPGSGVQVSGRRQEPPALLPEEGGAQQVPASVSRNSGEMGRITTLLGVITCLKVCVLYCPVGSHLLHLHGLHLLRRECPDMSGRR